jgi:hypothetical protein
MINVVALLRCVKWPDIGRQEFGNASSTPVAV